MRLFLLLYRKKKAGDAMVSFNKIKQAVTARQAAEQYGINVNRYGFACCPFHHDKGPSMKIDTRYHCFSCNEDGDAIDFTAKLFGISLKEAAEKLAEDFSIDSSSEGNRSFYHWEPKTNQEWVQKNFYALWDLLCEYLQVMREQKEQYEPKTLDDPFDDRYVEAVYAIEFVGMMMDILWEADWKEREAIMNKMFETPDKTPFEQGMGGSSSPRTITPHSKENIRKSPRDDTFSKGYQPNKHQAETN